jgi:hypothetical protein
VSEPTRRPPSGGAVPGVLRRWARTVDRWDAGAAVVTTSFLASTLWLTAGGGLYIDDIRAQAYAADRPIWPFIVESNRTHLAPAARTVDWLHATYAPLEHWPAVVVTLIVAVTLAVALWVCVRWVVGQPAVALVGLYLALFSATIVPSLAWYRQALTGVAAFALLLVTCILSVRFVSGGSRVLLPVAALTHLVALGFSERALIAPVLLLAVLVLLRPDGLGALRGRGVAVLGVLGAVNIGFLGVYLTGDYDRGESTQPTVAGFLLSSAYSLVRNTLPAYAGGPLRWYGDGTYGYADTPVPLAAVAAVVAGGIVLLALRRDRGRSVRILATAAAFMVPLYAIIYVGRVAKVTEVSVVDDLRLHSDAAIVGAVALAALLGVVLEGRPRGPARRRGPRPTTVAGVAGVLAVVAGTAVSWGGFASRWHTNDSPEYFDTLRSALSHSSGTVVPGPVPEALVPWWVQPDFNTQSLVRLLSPDTETVVLRQPAGAVAFDGSIVEAELLGLEQIGSSTELCVLNVPAGVTAGLVLPRDPIPPRRHQLLEIGLLVGDTTHVGVAVIDEAGVEHPAAFFRPPLLHRGPSRILATVPLDTLVTGVVVKALDRNTTGLCIASVTSVLSRATL